MYELVKTFPFEAGHTLEAHDGACRMPHGHSYTMAITIRGESITPSGPKENMLIDFHDIGSIVKPMVETYLDHKWLNDTLQTKAPTAEYIAKWVFDYLQSKLPGLFRVSISETATSTASWEASGRPFLERK